MLYYLPSEPHEHHESPVTSHYSSHTLESTAHHVNHMRPLTTPFLGEGLLVCYHILTILFKLFLPITKLEISWHFCNDKVVNQTCCIALHPTYTSIHSLFFLTMIHSCRSESSCYSLTCFDKTPIVLIISTMEIGVLPTLSIENNNISSVLKSIVSRLSSLYRCIVLHCSVQIQWLTTIIPRALFLRNKGNN